MQGSTKPQHESEPRDLLAHLQPLLSDASIGPAAKWAYAFLYRAAGFRPKTITTTAFMLGAFFGCSGRAAWKWLATLAERQWIELAERDRRRGTVSLFVYSPDEIFNSRLVQLSPQLQLPGLEAEDPAPVRLDVWARKGPSDGRLSAQRSIKRPSESAAPPWEPGWETPRAHARTRAFDDSYDLSSSTIEPKGGDLRLTIDGLCRRLWPAGRKTIDCQPDLRTLYWLAVLLNSAEHRPWVEHVLDTAELKPRSGIKRMLNPFAYLQGCLQKQRPWIVGSFVPAEFVKPLAIPSSRQPAPADPAAPPVPPTDDRPLARRSDAEWDDQLKLVVEMYRNKGMPIDEARARAREMVGLPASAADPQPPKPR